MGILIDTSLFVGAERGYFDVKSFLTGVAATEPIYIASITASELLHGVERASSAGRRRKRAAFVESILSDYPVLPFGLSEARTHAKIWAHLKSKGQMIGPHDLLIAAIALAHHLPVATLNVTEFSRLKELSVIDGSPYGTPS